MNIDACRIVGPPSVGGDMQGRPLGILNDDGWNPPSLPIDRSMAAGRFPANLVLSHSEGCALVGTKKIKAVTGTSAGRETGGGTRTYGAYSGNANANRPTGFADADGKEEVENWTCQPDCAVALLNDQTESKMHSAGKARSSCEGSHSGSSNTTYQKGVGGAAPRFGDAGGASRFFYTAKAPTSEKWAVLVCDCTKLLKVKDIPVLPMKEAKAAHGSTCPSCEKPKELTCHPTVKSISLMDWLVKLVTPPGGLVLDPFSGSGSTGVAAQNLGFRFLGVEQDTVYCALARHRLKQ